jgi:histidine ammonia-lyase
MAPLLKVAEALASEIVHGAAPTSIHSPAGSDAVEDAATGAPLAARRLLGLLDRLRLLVALELVVAAQAVDLRGRPELGAATGSLYERVRALVPPLRRGDAPPQDLEPVRELVRQADSAISSR